MALVTIYIEDDQKKIQVEAGRTLDEICDEYPSSLLFACREASCGTCLMQVASGYENLSPVTSNEQEMLEVLAPGNAYARLACQCTVLGDVQISAL